MKEPVWLTKDVVLAVQDELLSRFGGLAGTRDEGLLDSAIARSRQVYAYEEATNVFQLAAVYAHGLVKNHPFMDGNKRIGFMAAYIFLGINGQDLDAPEEQAAIQTLALAAGDSTEADYAEWIELSCKG